MDFGISNQRVSNSLWWLARGRHTLASHISGLSNARGSRDWGRIVPKSARRAVWGGQQEAIGLLEAGRRNRQR